MSQLSLLLGNAFPTVIVSTSVHVDPLCFRRCEWRTRNPKVDTSKKIRSGKITKKEKHPTMPRPFGTWAPAMSLPELRARTPRPSMWQSRWLFDQRKEVYYSPEAMAHFTGPSAVQGRRHGVTPVGGAVPFAALRFCDADGGHWRALTRTRAIWAEHHAVETHRGRQLPTAHMYVWVAPRPGGGRPHQCLECGKAAPLHACTLERTCRGCGPVRLWRVHRHPGQEAGLGARC
jgi:hypothetical protein